ncbi:MAG: Crp/Fnr family transcriptional regulator [Bacteroidetes bacterium]|nr:Crp/Fnr family transcriptional regulator [Bacteroidota bacterium]
MTVEPLIKYVSAFSDISDNDVRLLKQFFKPADFLKGSTLEKENTVAQKLYFIRNGFIRIFCTDDGTEVTTQIVGPNNFITGFNSFVSGTLSKENIKCISNCDLLYITKSDYNELTKESAIWSAFCKQVYEKAISLNQQRTTDLLTLSAEKRYLKLLAEQPELIQNVPILYVASYIGIKPESLSRIRKKIIS